MKKKVIVLGGGVAGMSTAHELIERGFEVTVYDKHRNYCGGKARSVNVPSTNKMVKDKYLPGEHGFRFFPGFYRHIIDTMERIPFKNQKNGVVGNLTKVDRVGIYRKDKKAISAVVNFPKSLDDIKTILSDLHSDTGLTSEEKHFFAEKIWQLMTTCYDRRATEYEKIGWWEFLEADRFSKNYQTMLVQGITRTLVAANAKTASTKTDGDILLQLMFNISNPNQDTDRVLNGPTNDVWLNPWMDYLKSKGVVYHSNYSVKKLELKNGEISGAWVETYKSGIPEQTLVTADYYVLAVPVEAAAKVVKASDGLVNIGNSFKNIIELAPSVAWMNGVQFYLSDVIDVVHGHCLYVDSPWALTSISQLQFWKDYDMSERLNGKVKSILSVDVSDWDDFGVLEHEVVDAKTGEVKKIRKKAKNCSYKELKEEVWQQLKSSLNVDGKEVLKDDHILHWYIDRDITIDHHHPDQDENKEPLLVNTVDSWKLRPEAKTEIPNLFLASDYVRTFTDLATMEGANEAARKSVNEIIKLSGIKAKPCEIWDLHEPNILAPLRERDQKRYDKGLPFELHVPFLLKVIKAVIGFFSKLFK